MMSSWNNNLNIFLARLLYIFLSVRRVICTMSKQYAMSRCHLFAGFESRGSLLSFRHCSYPLEPTAYARIRVLLLERE